MVTSTHITNVFDDTLPQSIGFETVSLSLTETMDMKRKNSRGRRRMERERKRELRERNIFLFDGFATFETSEIIDSQILVDATMDAFSDENLNSYETLLRNADIDVLASFIQLKNDAIATEDDVEDEDSENKMSTDTSPMNDQVNADSNNVNGINDETVTFKAMESVYVVWGLVATTCVTFIVLSIAAVQKHRSNMSYDYDNFMGSETISSHGKLSSVQSHISATTPSQKSESPGRYIHFGINGAKMSGAESSLSDENTKRSLENHKKVSFSEDDEENSDSDFELPVDYEDFRAQIMSRNNTAGYNFIERDPYLQFQTNTIDHMQLQDHNRRERQVQTVQNDVVPDEPPLENKPRKVWKRIPSVRRSNQAWYNEQGNYDEADTDNQALEGTMFI